jgi:hypothetical protein
MMLTKKLQNGIWDQAAGPYSAKKHKWLSGLGFGKTATSDHF